MKNIWSGIVLSLCLLGVSFSFAEDRALLIGIADYIDTRNDLDGPETDIKLMLEIVERMGFTSEQVQVMHDEEATQSNITETMKSWLVDGVTADDRVLLYYTGHGQQSEDDGNEEDDGCDEGLVSYSGHMVTDDELNTILSTSAASEILVIVDSCFSGNLIDTRSAKRAIKTGRQPKLYTPKSGKIINCNTPANYLKSTRDIGVTASEETKAFSILDQRSIFISAADQNQVAYASLPEQGGGSLFTQSLYNQLMTNQDITFSEVVDSVAHVIKDTIEGEGDPDVRPHTPTLVGPASWQSQNFFNFGSLDKGLASIEHPIDTALNGIMQNSYFEVDITTPRLALRLGEKLEFTVRSSEAGYLYVYDRGASGNLTLLFPNEFAPSPYHIQANESITLPDALLTFTFPAQEPTGVSRIVAIVSEKELPFYTEPICGISGAFRSCAPAQSKQIASRFSRDLSISAKDFGIETAAPKADETNITSQGNSPRPVGTSFGIADIYVEVIP